MQRVSTILPYDFDWYMKQAIVSGNLTSSLLIESDHSLCHVVYWRNGSFPLSLFIIPTDQVRVIFH